MVNYPIYFGVKGREICERYRSDKKRYENGIKRCTACEAYLDYQGTQCPCCNTQLRPKRKAKYRS